MFGSVTRQKVCQPLAPSTTRGLFLLGALRLHQRDQLARDEREGDEDRRQHDARHGEDDLDVVLAQPRPEPALQRRTAARRSGPAITGETENGRSISVISTLLPRNSNLAIAQAAATPNTRFSGTAIAAASSVSRIAASASGSTIAREIDAQPFFERLDEHRDQRHEQEQRRGTPARRRSASSAPSGGSRGRVRGSTRRRARAGSATAIVHGAQRRASRRRAVQRLQQVDRPAAARTRRPASPPRSRSRRRSRTARAW